MRKLPILFFFCLLTISAQNLEGEIYTALDNFLANPSETALQKLTNQEEQFQNKLVSKKEQLALVILQCNKAYYLKEKGNFLSAIKSYEEAWIRFKSEELTDYDISEFCLKPLGNSYIKTKNYSNAERIIKLYISRAERKRNLEQKIAGIINLCLLYQTIGEHETVIKILEDTIELYNINEVQRAKIEAIKSKSLIFSKNIDNRIKSDYSAYQQKLLQGDYKSAYTFFKKAQLRNTENILSKRDKVKWLLEEAQLLMVLDKKKDSNDRLNQALSVLNFNDSHNRLYPESLLIDIFDMKAQLTTDVNLSLDFYDKSFYIEGLLKEKTIDQQTQLLYNVKSRKRSEKCIELALHYYEYKQDNNFLVKAFQYANKGKSTLLSRRKKIRKLRDSNPKDSLLILEKQLQTLKEKLISKISKKGQDFYVKDSIEWYQLSFSKVNKDLISINQKLNNKFKVLDTDQVNLSGLKNNAKMLEAAFVTYFFGKNNIYQFIVDENDLKIHTIEITPELKKDIIDYIKLFDSPNTIVNNVDVYTKLAFKLYKSLKFDELTSYSNIGIITDGLLNFVPFETLLTQKTSTLFFKKMPFVIKKQNLVYNFNVDMFSAEENSVNDFEVAGFFPVFNNTPKELLFSKEEAEVIKSNFKSELYLNNKANADNFIKELNSKEVLHISTHSENKGISSEAYIDFYDKKIFLNDLYAFHTKADLVVLSACETGVGSLIKGEGAMSLARGFSYIGAENILFTLWKVNDKSSSEIVKNFYKELRHEESISIANYQAKLEYINNPNIENAYKSPYYWGAFVYYGSLDIQNDSQQLLYVIFSFLLLFIIFLQIRKRIK
jgi:CHAT domain-containing protein